MKTAGVNFQTAEASAIQVPALQVIVRPNPEELTWTHSYTGTGKTGTMTLSSGAAFGWKNIDVQDQGSVCVTAAGTLLRSFGVPFNYDSTKPIYVNRVTAGVTNLQSALSVWEVEVNGYDAATREALAADATKVRLFYVENGSIVYRDSTNDGVSFGTKFTVEGNGLMGLSVLSAPDPEHLFVCQRKSGGGLSEPQVQYLQLTSYHLGNSGWIKTEQQKPSTRTGMDSNNMFWDGAFQFDAAVVDAAKGIYCVVMMDDLAGRPASCTWHNRFWSDYFPVEAIDFAEPERDEVIGLRLTKIDNKLILSARRIASDSDFVSTRQGVIYYSIDGKRWSDPYFVCEATGTNSAPYNWGTPAYWRNKIWLVGVDSLWEAERTAFFGGDTPNKYELDITDAVVNCAVEEPEDRIASSTISVTLDNTLRQWNNHPLLRADDEVEIRAGYGQYAPSTNILPNPSFEVNSTGWVGMGSSIVTRASARSFRGAWSLRVDVAGGENNGEGRTDSVPILNREYTFSIYVYNGNIPNSGSVMLGVAFLGGVQPTSSYEFVTVATAEDAKDRWRRYQRTVKVDFPDRANARFAVRLTGATANGQQFFLDAAQVEEGPFATEFVDHANDPWGDTGKVTLITGTIEQPAPTSSREGESRMGITGTDYIANLKQGEMDRTFVLSQPLRQATPLASADDIDLFAQASGSGWEHVQKAGDRYARATRKGNNSLIRGTGSPGNVSVSARFRITNTLTCQVGLQVGLTPNGKTYYILRGGKDTTRWELWRVRFVASMKTQIITKLATSNVSLPTVPQNQWFSLTFIQRQSRLMCYYAPENEEESYVLFNYFDPVPLNDSGAVAVRATLPRNKPEAGAWDQVHVDDIRTWDHRPQSTLEEFLHSLAILRGFEGTKAEAQIDETWQSGTTGWTVKGTGGAWSSTPGALTYNGASKNVSHLWALRSPVRLANAIVDLDMRLGATDAGHGRMGVMVRTDSTCSSGIVLAVEGVGSAHTLASLQVINNDSLIKYQHMRTMMPVYADRRTIFRFVSYGPWHTIYANDAMLAMFYESLKEDDEGWIALSGGVSKATGDATIYRVRIPWLDFGDVPFLQPGDRLDEVITSVIEANRGWMQAEGRILEMGKTLPQNVVGTIDESVLLNGGYQPTYVLPYTHVRVVSQDPDGREITGTVYSPTLWRGRMRMRTENVPGMQNEKECRSRAWQFLLDQERAARTRAYEVHPRLLWERYDLFDVENTLDDTNEQLYLTGINRSWSRNPSNQNLQLSMTIRMEEKSTVKLERSTTVNP